ncbi:hypothetical protein H632_c3533p0, partial [Helicosporidium sp. ATCC 50920]
MPRATVPAPSAALSSPSSPSRYPNTPPRDVLVVDSAVAARRVAARLMSAELADRVFACDTEVASIDVAGQSPYLHGRVICLSIYAGPDLDFGAAPGQAPGPAGARRSIIWADTLLDGTEATAAESRAILEAFAPFLRCFRRQKVWHNYSFDRAVLAHEGLACGAFGGDTMHMARMWDSSRKGKGYSLESLSSDPALWIPPEENDAGKKKGAADVERATDRFLKPLAKRPAAFPAATKHSMKSEFARPRLLRSGQPGKVTYLPPVEEIQTDPDTRWRWIRYSARDAEATWQLYRSLRARLEATAPVAVDDPVRANLAAEGVALRSMWDVYAYVWRPLGEVLTRMEMRGMPLDRAFLQQAQARAEADAQRAREYFGRW